MDGFDDNGGLSPTVLTPTGDLLVGTGITGLTGFAVATDAADAPGVEIGLKAFVRYAGTYALDPSDPTGHTYVVNSGSVAQGPDAYNQSGGQDDGWARWNFAISLGADTDGNGGSLRDYGYTFTIAKIGGAGEVIGTPVNVSFADYLAQAVAAGAITAGQATAILDGKVFQDAVNFGYLGIPGFDPTQEGTWRISVTATDSENVTALSNHIDVKIVNDAPDAADDSFATDEDHAITLTAAQLLGNDADPNLQILSVTVVGGATNGTIFDNGNGTYTFTPAHDFNGTATFTYTVTDGQSPALTDTATVSINVAAVNDAPVALNPTFTPISEDGPAFSATLGSVDLPFLLFGSDVDSSISPSSFSFVSATMGSVTFASTTAAGHRLQSVDRPIHFRPDRHQGLSGNPAGNVQGRGGDLPDHRWRGNRNRHGDVQRLRRQ